MAVTLTHQGLGGFSLALRPGGAVDDFVARLNPFDHVFVTPKGLGPQPNLASLKATSVFSGRVDQLEMDGGSVVLGGPSIAVWMGDEAGRGRFPSGPTTGVLTATVNGWLQVIFGLANPALGWTGGNLNGLTTQTSYWQNLPSGNIVYALERFKTVRQALDEIAALADRPFEWLVKPSGEIWVEGWAGSVDYTKTVFSFFPEVLLADGMARTDGMSRWTSPQTAQVPLQVFPADISVSWNFADHAARGIARGNDNGTPLASTGTNKNTFETNGFSFDPTNRIGWDTLVDFDTDDAGLLQAAANSVGRLASIRREWTVQAGSSAMVGFLKAGDYVWIHAADIPGIGSMTYAEEAEIWAGINAVSDPAVARFAQAANVNVGGANIYPVRGRVESMTFPCSDRFSYWFASTWDGSGDVRLIDDLIDFDVEGPVTLDVNGAKPRWQLQRKVLGNTVGRGFDLQANTRRSR